MNNIDIFKQQSAVLDTETTNLYPELAEVVEVAGAVLEDHAWSADSMLLGAYNGIPPEASAKNNISNRMIANLPKFDQSIQLVKAVLAWDTKQYFVAHNATYDRTALATSFEKMGSDIDVAQCKDDNRWICTYRLSKHIIDNEFNDMQYNLSYLRYKLDLPIPDSTAVHRASDDTLVCASLLDYLLELAITTGKIDAAHAVGPQLVKLCWSHIPAKSWPLGKYKGQPLVDVPTDYYIWALKNVSQLQEGQSGYDYDLAESVRAVLESRVLENS